MDLVACVPYISQPSFSIGIRYIPGHAFIAQNNGKNRSLSYSLFLGMISVFLLHANPKANASFGSTILMKAMPENATINKHAVEGLYPKSGDWIMMEGGDDYWQLFHWILPPWPQHDN